MLIGRPLGRQREQRLGVGGKILARDRGDAGRDPAVRIARRDPDRLGAEIEPDEGAARGQGGRDLDEGGNRHEGSSFPGA
jgi:hypothetical protein